MKKNSLLGKGYVFIKNNWWYIFIICLLIFLCYLFPYVHDDWAWGSRIGIDRLNVWFAKKDGRYAGSLLVLLLTRFRFLKSVVMVLSFSLIVFLIGKIINLKRKDCILLSIALFLLMPTTILADGVTWTSAFCNYVPPIIMILTFLYLCINYNECSKILIVFCFLLGFIGSLFIEHITILSVIFGVSAIIYLFWKKRKTVLLSGSYAIGAIIGAVVMFSNSGYRDVANNVSQYSVSRDNIIISAFKQYFSGFYKFFILNNVVLNVVFSILILWVLYLFIKNKKKISNFKKITLLSCAFVVLIFLTYTLFINLVFDTNLFVKNNYRMYVEGFMCLLFFVSTFVISVMCIDDSSVKLKVIITYFLLSFGAAPLLIVNPLGARQFFPIYVLFVLLVVLLFAYLVKKENRFIILIMKSLAFILIVFYLVIFFYVFKIDAERVRYVEKNKHSEQTVIYIPRLPSEKLMHHSSPVNEEFKRRYKLFYGIDEAVQIEVVPYKKWKKLK